MPIERAECDENPWNVALSTVPELSIGRAWRLVAKCLI